MQNLEVKFKVTALLSEKQREALKSATHRVQRSVLNCNSVLAEIKIIRERNKNSEYIVI